MKSQLRVVLKKPINECTKFLEVLKTVSNSDFATYTFSNYNLEELMNKERAKRNPNKLIVKPLNLYKEICVTEMALSEAIVILKNCDEIESVNKIIEPEIVYIATDPHWVDLWHFHANESYGMNIEQAWDIENTFGEGMVIATIEPYNESCRFTHEDFGSVGNVETDWASIIAGTHPSLLSSTFNGAPDKPSDSWGHNTMTSSVIVAQMNNNKGFCGVAPKAKVKLFYYQHEGINVVVNDSVLDAIVRAASQNVDVISLSLSGCFDDAPTIAAVQTALNLGVPCVWAAGPNDDFNVNFNNTPNAFVVGSCDKLGVARYTYGSREFVGPGIDVYRASAYDDLTTPGINIPSNNSYRLGSGNSLATPLVAGVVALLMKKHPEWSLGDIRQALTIMRRSRTCHGFVMKETLDSFGPSPGQGAT